MEASGHLWNDERQEMSDEDQPVKKCASISRLPSLTMVLVPKEPLYFDSRTEEDT